VAVITVTPTWLVAPHAGEPLVSGYVVPPAAPNTPYFRIECGFTPTRVDMYYATSTSSDSVVTRERTIYRGSVAILRDPQVLDGVIPIEYIPPVLSLTNAGTALAANIGSWGFDFGNGDDGGSGFWMRDTVTISDYARIYFVAFRN
jgi:hypothetical protein